MTESAASASDNRGIYRRRIRLSSTHNLASGELEDDFHQFRVELGHDGEQILSTAGSAPRPPWTTCAGALQPLQQVEGMRITDSSIAVRDHTDMRRQCTHIFDLTGLLVAQISRGEGQREYRFTVPDRVERRTVAIAQLDGEEVLRFEISGSEIVAPEPFAGHSLRHGPFSRWAALELAPEEAELAIALHRVSTISLGRRARLDELQRASEFKGVARNACHSFSDGIVDDALRVLGTQHDHTRSPEHWPAWPDPLWEESKSGVGQAGAR